MTTSAPIPTVPPCDCAAPPSSGRVQCGRCGKVFCAGAVVTGNYEMVGGHRQFIEGKFECSEEHGDLVAQRRLFCDHCHHIQSWLEFVQADPLHPDRGNLTGQIAGGPGYIRDKRQIDRFLREFPAAAGVEQT